MNRKCHQKVTIKFLVIKQYEILNLKEYKKKELEAPKSDASYQKMYKLQTQLSKGEVSPTPPLPYLGSPCSATITLNGDIVSKSGY